MSKKSPNGQTAERHKKYKTSKKFKANLAEKAKKSKLNKYYYSKTIITHFRMWNYI